VGHSLAPDAVIPRLRGRFGRPYRYAIETSSTQRLLTNADPEGSVAVAEHQTEGRGRLDRRWESAPGTSLLASVLLRPPAPPARLSELAVLTAEAIAEAIEAVAGIGAAVKHPNDVLIRGRKVAGVLGEADGEAVVLGIGLNANIHAGELPRETRLPATSLLAETDREVDRVELLATTLECLERRYRSWTWRLPGATAIVVPVPEAEAVVGDWRRLYTPSGAEDVPAHVTLLSPFVPASRLDERGEHAVRDLIADADEFEFRLAEAGRFDGVLYLVPDPAAPFVELTGALTARFPDYPPYDGTVTEIVPHLTIAQGSKPLFDGLCVELEPRLPITAVAATASLLERAESGRFRLRASYPLGRSDG
jgi:BirA family biotin operon repressor/biotin-[acetyl-CoA-carboxylase] ligase